ncbi:hypothetical protein L0F63_006207, partial [Massospora cicadina]
MPQPKSSRPSPRQSPKKAANAKAPAKLRKATVSRTDSITTIEVNQAKAVAVSDYEVPMVPEGGAPTLAPIFNATPHKRKVVYSCFFQPDAEVKVVNSMAPRPELCGGNNVNLITLLGQFSSHTYGGKDAGAARYISTCIKPITRPLFHKDDMVLLNYLDDDSIKMEPEWFVP